MHSPVKSDKIFISSKFGEDRGTYIHKGLDIDGKAGDEIYAAQKGTVVFSGQTERGGNEVVIKHNNGLATKYSHLKELNVQEGDKVNQKTVIGTMGSTGHIHADKSDGDTAHLHYEVMKDGKNIDPEPFLDNEKVEYKKGDYGSGSCGGTTSWSDFSSDSNNNTSSTKNDTDSTSSSSCSGTMTDEEIDEKWEEWQNNYGDEETESPDKSDNTDEPNDKQELKLASRYSNISKEVRNEIKNVLREGGYDPSNIEEFQRLNGLEETGVVDNDTLVKLNGLKMAQLREENSLPSSYEVPDSTDKSLNELAWDSVVNLADAYDNYYSAADAAGLDQAVNTLALGVAPYSPQAAGAIKFAHKVGDGMHVTSKIIKTVDAQLPEDKSEPINLSQDSKALLEYGDSGETIKNIQKEFAEAGYNVETNGEYDDKFRQVIKNYQKDNNLKATGKIDSETMSQMSEDFTQSNDSGEVSISTGSC